MIFINLPQHQSININIRLLHRRVSCKTGLWSRPLLLIFHSQYSISRSQLFTRSMLISVWHHGRLSRNAFLGEVEIPLDCRDLDTAYEDAVALMPKVDKHSIDFSLIVAQWTLCKRCSVDLSCKHTKVVFTLFYSPKHIRWWKKANSHY